MWGPRFSAHRTEAFSLNLGHHPAPSMALSGLWTCPEGCSLPPSPGRSASRTRWSGPERRRQQPGARETAVESWQRHTVGTSRLPRMGAGLGDREGGRRAAGKREQEVPRPFPCRSHSTLHLLLEGSPL